MTEEDKKTPRRNYTPLVAPLIRPKGCPPVRVKHSKQIDYLLKWISTLTEIPYCKLRLDFLEKVGGRIVTRDRFGHIIYSYSKRHWKWVRAYKNLLKFPTSKKYADVEVPEGNWYSCNKDLSWGFMKLLPGETAGKDIIEILPTDLFCPWKWYPGRDKSPEDKAKLFAARLAQKYIWAEEKSKKETAKAKNPTGPRKPKPLVDPNPPKPVGKPK
jgi:hypothetical protein